MAYYRSNVTCEKRYEDYTSGGGVFDDSKVQQVKLTAVYDKTSKKLEA